MTPRWLTRDRKTFNAHWNKWYRANAKKKIAWQYRRRLEIRAWFAELKATKQCERCGESTPECLHFHHVDPSQKKFEIGVAASTGKAKPVLLAEIAKCIVLCANCHAKEHWELDGRGLK